MDPFRDSNHEQRARDEAWIVQDRLRPAPQRASLLSRALTRAMTILAYILRAPARPPIRVDSVNPIPASEIARTARG